MTGPLQRSEIHLFFPLPFLLFLFFSLRPHTSESGCSFTTTSTAQTPCHLLHYLIAHDAIKPSGETTRLFSVVVGCGGVWRWCSGVWRWCSGVWRCVEVV